MTNNRNLTRAKRWLLDRLEALTRSRALRLLRGLEPAFLVFTVLGVIIATIALWLDLSARKEERISRAWQTVSSTARGNTGKADALKFLAAKGQDLRWMHLAPGSTDDDRIVDCRYRVFVPGLDLRGGQLDNANLSCSDLDSGDADTGTARFDRASLQNSSWIRTKAERASFRQASLISADFRGARLGNADFGDADLTQAKFAYADLRGASFSPKSAEGIGVHMADLRGVRGLTCDELKRMDDWQSACRESDLDCGTPSKGQCGPVAVPADLRLPVSGVQGFVKQTPPACNKIDIQRDIAFRLDQVDRVVDGEFVIESRDASGICARARSIFVVAKLGGIARRPPPKEDETVWIGGSGYGYRHTPFKTGARSDKFASFSLPELVTDYLSCASKTEPEKETELRSAVDKFEKTAAAHEDRVRKCDEQWVRDATQSWKALRETARDLAEITD